MKLNLEPIVSYLTNQPVVSSVYLFGSHAKGTARPDSDVDIAVLFTQGLSKKARFDLRLNLAGDLEDILLRTVDLIDLEEATYLLCHQIFLHGLLIIKNDQKQLTEFVVRSRREYFDFKKFIEQRNNAILFNS